MDIINKELLDQMIEAVKTENEAKKPAVKIVDVKSLMPFGNEVAIFNGFENNANVSFYLVNFSPGVGPRKHRHPYEETFIVLEGEIEAIVEGKTFNVPEGNIMIVPANTWHEFSNKSDKKVRTVNIHPVAKMLQEWYTE